MKKLILLLGFLALILGFQVAITYGLFENDYDIEVDSDLAKWKININDSDVTGSSKTFVVNNLAFSENENVLSGRWAPSMEAYFDIVLDPTDTKVSIRYDLELDLSAISNPEITLKEITEVNGYTLIRISENTYTGIITYDDIIQNVTHDIKVTLVWNNNEDNNSNDYMTSSSGNRTIEIPVKVNLSQYLDEEIVEYQ